jgi:DNA primase
MIDTTHIDLLHLIGSSTELRKATGSEYQGACPFCGGRDRFRVWPEDTSAHRRGWWCRGCETGGDAIAFVRQRDACTFGEALRTLGIEGDAAQEPAQQAVRPPEPVQAPPEEWRQRMAGFVNWCQGQWTEEARAYLHSRGLTDTTIDTAGLGYNPRDWYLAPDALGLDRERNVWLPRGIVMPWYVDGALWKVVVRRPANGTHKYHTVAGSSNCPYGIDGVQSDKPAMLVEGPLDKLAVQQAAGDIIAPVAVGTTSARKLRWIAAIARASTVLVTLDNDEAGNGGASYWLDALQGQARLWRPLWGDPAQMIQDGADVRQWVRDGLGEPEPADDYERAVAWLARHPDSTPEYIRQHAPADMRAIIRAVWNGQQRRVA